MFIKFERNLHIILCDFFHHFESLTKLIFISIYIYIFRYVVFFLSPTPSFFVEKSVEKQYFNMIKEKVKHYSISSAILELALISNFISVYLIFYLLYI